MKRLSCFAVLAVVAGCAAPESEPEVSTAAVTTATAPIALDGTYAFKGEMRASARLTVDVVDTRMSDAAPRLAALRAEGASCPLVASQTYRCTKLRPAGEVAAASLEKLAAKNAGLAITFGRLEGSPHLITDAESLTEWEIPQSGTGPLGAFDTYTYRALENGPTKIALGDSDEYTVEDGGHIVRWNSTIVHEGRWRWHEDIAFAVLSH